MRPQGQRELISWDGIHLRIFIFSFGSSFDTTFGLLTPRHLACRQQGCSCICLEAASWAIHSGLVVTFYRWHGQRIWSTMTVMRADARRRFRSCLCSRWGRATGLIREWPFGDRHLSRHTLRARASGYAAST